MPRAQNRLIMIRIIKSILLTTCLLASAAGAQETVTLKVGGFETTPGEKIVLTVESDVELNGYCSFQFDLLLPDGIVLPYNMNTDEEEEQFGYYNEQGEWRAAIESGITKSSHILACSAIEGGYRFVCYHPEFSTFKSGNRNVLTLHLQANENVVNGVYRISLGGTMIIAGEDSHIVPNTETSLAIIRGSERSVTYDFVMNDAGWGTLILPFDANIPAGLAAYNCIDVKDETVILAESTTLYANTPYLLNGVSDTYSFTGIPNADRNEYSNGCMTGVHTDTSIAKGYVLQVNSGTAAFYKVEENTPLTVPAAHCFIDRECNTPVLYISGTAGIEGITGNNERDEIYRINGVRVESAEENNLYIINKKKIIK